MNNMHVATKRQLEDVAKVGLNLILEELEKDGKLTNEDVKHYHMNYTIIIRKPSHFASIWKKILGKDDVDQYILVKQCSIKESREN